MPEPQLIVALVVAALVAGAIAVVLVIVVLARLGSLARGRDAQDERMESLSRELAVVRAQGEDLERDLKLDMQGARAELRQDLAIARDEHGKASQTLRGEVGERLMQFAGTVEQQFGGLTRGQGESFTAFGARLQDFAKSTQEALRAAADQQAIQARTTAERLADLAQRSDQKLEAIRLNVEQRLDTLRHENAAKLEQMRVTVDEKLQSTLEARLSSSFQQVSERLEQVHKGLGEMQSLAVGVGDLKRVMSNVKSRGTWGEVRLEALLADLLTPAQYERNVATRPTTNERVDFAIRLPGRDDGAAACWLPIDAKFPSDGWLRLQDAFERADPQAVETSRRELETFFRQQSKSIREKYVEPPHTTDFAILFVPTEGLFAEAVARPGLAEALQRDFRVTLAGPTTLAVMLNALQLGFRTLAIEKRSTEVWRTLGAVRTEFGKFGDILARARKKLDEAGNTLDLARGKSTTIARKLREVEALPDADAERLLGTEAAGPLELDVDQDSSGAGPDDVK